MSDRSRLKEEALRCPPGEDILAYVQAELMPREQAWFENHCGSCASCRRRIDEFKGVLSSMRDVPAPVMSRDLAPLILARIPAAEWGHPARWFDIHAFLPQLARAAALILMLATAATMVLVVVQRKEREQAAASVAGARSPAVVQPQRSDAIAGGLAWLAANQEDDGSWDAVKWGARKEHTVGITALSLLAFIGKDSEPGNGAYAGTVRRGIRYLVGQQDAGGRLGPVCANTMYNHGMATVALMKVLRLNPDKTWKDAGDRAVDFLCASQKESGGWGYLTGNADAANTSVTVWELQSLMLAESMGRTDLSPRIERSMAWLRGMVDGNGRMGYSREEEAPNGYDTLTAAGVLCLLAGDTNLRDRDRVAQLVKSLEASAGQQGKTIDYYRWYFMTHALKAAGGVASKEFAGQLQDTLIAKQTHKGPGAGSWELDDRWSPAGGRIYTTSMAVLSLE